MIVSGNRHYRTRKFMNLNSKDCFVNQWAWTLFERHLELARESDWFCWNMSHTEGNFVDVQSLIEWNSCVLLWSISFSFFVRLISRDTVDPFCYALSIRSNERKSGAESKRQRKLWQTWLHLSLSKRFIYQIFHYFELNHSQANGSERIFFVHHCASIRIPKRMSRT